MQQRYYDAEIGTFLSVDPVTPMPGNVFNFNRYAYANNNPIVNTDPTGAKCFRGNPVSCNPEDDRPPPPKPTKDQWPPGRPNGCGYTRDCYYDSGSHAWHTDRFNWGDAVYHWSHGNGSTITVNAGQLNLLHASYQVNPDGSYLIHTKLYYDTGAIYGTVTGTRNIDGSLSFLPDVYNFDFKSPFGPRAQGERWRLMIRDLANAAGIVINGPGDAYRIDITGSVPWPNGWQK